MARRPPRRLRHENRETGILSKTKSDFDEILQVESYCNYDKIIIFESKMADGHHRGKYRFGQNSAADRPICTKFSI